MNRTPRISDTEWEIMRIVWTHHPIAAADIIARLTAADASWHPKTARTLLARLVEKGALDYEERGRSYVYAPRVYAAPVYVAPAPVYVAPAPVYVAPPVYHYSYSYAPRYRYYR